MGMKNMSKMRGELSEIVKEYGLIAGASVVGIAASKDFNLAPDGFKPTDVFPDCISVIVFGSPFPQEALLADSVEYVVIRNAINEKMTGIAKSVAKQIKGDGYKACDISGMGGKWVGGSDGRKEHFGHISLKHAAELAGLGLIGRNYLLTNPKYGNLLWFSAVLTNADLIPDKKAQYTICDSCNKCVDICPSGALNNPALFEKKGCSKFYTIINKKFEIKCFLCRKVCPYCYGK
jgi:epoxyqueuosine reductase QueG